MTTTAPQAPVFTAPLRNASDEEPFWSAAFSSWAIYCYDDSDGIELVVYLWRGDRTVSYDEFLDTHAKPNDAGADANVY